MKLTEQQRKVLKLMIWYLKNDINGNGAIYIRIDGVEVNKDFTRKWFKAIYGGEKTFMDADRNKNSIGTEYRIKKRLNLLRDHYMDYLKRDIEL